MLPAGVEVVDAGGVTCIRCGMNSLALKVQQVLAVILMAAKSSASGAQG